MVAVSRTFTVRPAPEVVRDYLKDFANAEEWDPGTQSCTRQGAGPIEVGTSWRNVSRFAGRTAELTYTLRELASDRLVFVGINESATSTDTISLRPDGDGTQISYRADLELRGLARLASPVVKLLFEKVAGDTEQQMREVIDRIA